MVTLTTKQTQLAMHLPSSSIQKATETVHKAQQVWSALPGGKSFCIILLLGACHLEENDAGDLRRQGPAVNLFAARQHARGNRGLQLIQCLAYFLSLCSRGFLSAASFNSTDHGRSWVQGLIEV